MKKKGFVLIETIIVLVVLLSALVLLYSGFNNLYIKEQNYLYYDDIAYVYKTEYIRRYLFEGANSIVNIDNFKAAINDSTLVNDNNPFYHLERDNTTNNNNIINNQESFTALKELYNIHDIIYVPYGKLEKFKELDVSNNNILIRLNSLKPSNLEFFQKFVDKLDVEKMKQQDFSGILIVIYWESKSGNAGTDSEYQYSECIKKPGKSTMDCESAINIAWVYDD